ncbi:NTP transferase domain-containing protein [Flagellimonas flava]|uniref:Probable molybdenum cofactor guanylyltransferase n=1 Tax=Flagellimonas flava TaxID=570519 RepID=A0A1M5ISV9_9FLAO|nr:NTP transferase domain-containing protein [Allomuricauda flava]SHG31397.1 molybdenum cofactor guanylyltransferase [Allomuricauda flava]
MEENIPQLYGLVLAGGKSTRMGSDKGLIDYHGVPQREYLYALLNDLCDKVYMSVRDKQQATELTGFDCILDNNQHRGPFNGILSAHRTFPQVAWLVLACDLPLLDADTLRILVKNRDDRKIATSFATNESGLPEPLVTIWEPEGLEQSLTYLKTAESSCPRKFLINSDIHMVHPEHDEVLYNANSLADYQFAKSKIG